MSIDLSFLANNDAMYAIHCSTEAEAEEFVIAMCEQWPEYAGGFSDGNPQWGRYRENTTYLPDVNGLYEFSRMTFESVRWFREEGEFQIIEFSELIAPDVEADDLCDDLAVLLGMEVGT